MTWDLEKDVNYSDVGKAINWHPFEPEEHFDRRLGRHADKFFTELPYRTIDNVGE